MIAGVRIMAFRPPRLDCRCFTATAGVAIFGFRPPIFGLQPQARCFANTAGEGKAGAVAWLSSKMSKRISNMGALDVVKKAADKGDLQAITLMGVCHAIGRDVPQDDKVAAEWFRKAADGGQPEGALALGSWILEGRGGLKRDIAEAAKYIELASNKSVQEAHTMYGIMCNEGMGTPKDHQKAASLFSKAAAGGDLKALYNFGVLQIEGRGVKPAQSKGMDAVLRAATGGIPEAQFTVSIWYRDGALGTKQDNKKAFEWAMKAAKQGHTQAQHNVGVQLAEGVGVARNQRQAAEWYNKAVAAGQVESMCNLGGLLLTGAEGLDKDEKEGHILLHAAAERGHAPAQFNLALCYDRGLGVETDKAKALEWLRKSAALSFQPAMQELAVTLRSGSLGEMRKGDAVELENADGSLGETNEGDAVELERRIANAAAQN